MLFQTWLKHSWLLPLSRPTICYNVIGINRLVTSCCWLAEWEQVVSDNYGITWPDNNKLGTRLLCTYLVDKLSEFYVCACIILDGYMCYTEILTTFRAVPTGFWLGGGGCIPKFGPPPIPKRGVWIKKCVFGKQKVPKIFRKQHFSRNFQRTNRSSPKNFAILPCQGPLPASWAPLFSFFWGCYTPPRWHGPENERGKWRLSSQTIPRSTQYSYV
jgi:hypothetical protein